MKIIEMNKLRSMKVANIPDLKFCFQLKTYKCKLNLLNFTEELVVNVVFGKVQAYKFCLNLNYLVQIEIH